uniref:Uncharacterized protein n=1 Tax=Mustela putorius furo TaxID=9669 RepID=M3Z667_MUSPF
MPEGPHTGLPPSQTALKLGCLSSRSLGSFVAGGFLDPLLERLIRGAVGLGVLSPAQRGPAPEAKEDPPPSPISRDASACRAKFISRIPCSSQVFLCLPRDSGWAHSSQPCLGTSSSPSLGSPELPGGWGAGSPGPNSGGCTEGWGDRAPQPGAPGTAGPRHLALWGNSRGKQRRPPPREGRTVPPGVALPAHLLPTFVGGGRPLAAFWGMTAQSPGPRGAGSLGGRIYGEEGAPSRPLRRPAPPTPPPRPGPGPLTLHIQIWGCQGGEGPLCQCDQLLPEVSPAGLEPWLVSGTGRPAQHPPGFGGRTKTWIESCCAQPGPSSAGQKSALCSPGLSTWSPAGSQLFAV